MRVTSVESHGRNSEGRIVVGKATFSDGKVWPFYAVRMDDVYFNIDSGKVTAASFGHEVRMIAPVKRVQALHDYMKDNQLW